MPAITKYATPRAPLHQAISRTTGGVFDYVSGFPGMQYLGPAGNLYTAYNIGRGFLGGYKEGGFGGGAKGALRALPIVGSFFKGGGEEDIDSAYMEAAKRAEIELGNQYVSSLETREGIGRQAPHGLDIGSIKDIMSGAQKKVSGGNLGAVESAMGRISQLVQGGRGGGSKRLKIPIPQSGTAMPLTSKIVGGGLGVAKGNIPVVGVNTGGAGTTKTPPVTGDVVARRARMNKLIKILG